MQDKKTHKLFALKKAVNGQHYIETVSRNRKIGFVTEQFKRRQGAERAVKTLLIQIYEALMSIDGEFARIGELIDDRTRTGTPIPKSANRPK
jgi:uncharacterized protein YegP (UPF0339 family)